MLTKMLWFGLRTVRMNSVRLQRFYSIQVDTIMNPSRLKIIGYKQENTLKPKLPKKNTRIRVLRELLGPSFSLYAANNSLDTVDAGCSSPEEIPDPKQLEKTIVLLKQLGFSKEDIRKDIALLAKDKFTIDDTIQSLHELGIERIQTSYILKYPAAVSHVLEVAKAHFDLPQSFNIQDALLNQLDSWPTSSLSKLREAFSELEEASTTIADLKSVIFQHYFMWKLECSPEDAKRIVQHRAEILQRSLSYVYKIGSYLKRGGFTAEQITRINKLFRYEPNVLNSFCKHVPRLGTLTLPELLRDYPRLLEFGPDVVLPNLIALRCYGFSEEAIQNCIRLMYLDPSELRARLAQAEQIPEYNILRRHSRFLSVLLHYDRAYARLQDARQAHPHKISVQLLSCQNFRYTQAIANDKSHRIDDQLLQYLSEVVDESESSVRARLSEHPHWHHLELVHVQSVVEFLTGEGFSPEQMYRGIQLVLYPKSVIAHHLPKLVGLPELQPFTKWRNHPQTLQLLLYIIERNFHFSGNGIFSEPCNDDRDESGNSTVNNFPQEYRASV